MSTDRAPPELPPLPSDADLRRLHALMAPLRAVLRPEIDGWENLPDDRPLLFVGNHTLYGVIDTPHLLLALHARAGLRVRSLGDHAHFVLPGWRELVQRFGGIDGTPEACAAAFAAGESVLVFPGGAREAFKSPDDRYKLLWGERRGFARAALAAGVTVVPFAAVGADEVFELEDLRKHAIGEGLRAFGLRDDLMAPLPVGVRPQKLYLRLCAPVSPTGSADDPAAVDALREQTRVAIEAGIAQLLERRAQDPMADLPRYLGRQLGKGLNWLIEQGRRASDDPTR